MGFKASKIGRHDPILQAIANLAWRLENWLNVGALSSYRSELRHRVSSAEPSCLLSRLYFRRFLTDQSSNHRLGASRLSHRRATSRFELCLSRDEGVQLQRKSIFQSKSLSPNLHRPQH